MLMKYGKFEMAQKIVVDEESPESHFVRYAIAPFSKGFGHTLGNFFRRMLLSVIEAPSIISVQIEGVLHEFMAIEGIVEDMTNIVLNLKGALLRLVPQDESSFSRETRTLRYLLEVTQEDLDKRNGQYDVQLKDLIQGGIFEVVNPSLHLFSVTKPMKKQITLKVGFGRGYVIADRHVILDKEVNEIAIDAAFSPVRLVNYYVENTRVGQDTDFDRLLLEIKTDGRVTPSEALNFAAQIGEKHLQVFSEYDPRYTLSFDEKEVDQEKNQDKLMDKLSLGIDEIELSVRSENCLAKANIETLAELAMNSEKKMLDFQNFGKKSLNEIKDKLYEKGLHFGMDLSKFGITPENVKEKIRAYKEEKRKSKEALKDANS